MRLRTNGFTLLEVLLASVLAVTLLIGVWSLLSMQTRLFAKTPAQLEQSQLVRALYQQIADDLHASLFLPLDDPAKVTRFLAAGSTRSAAGKQPPTNDPSPRPPEGLTATVTTGGTGRPSALIGTAQSLHLQVLQVPLPQILPPTDSSTGASTQPDVAGDEQTGPLAPELRDVTYTFHPPDLIGVDTLTYQPGLIRREIAWDEADRQTGTASVPWIFRPESSDPATAADATQLTLTGPSPTDSQPATQRPPRHLVTNVPEVVGLEFRYFDGSGWTSGWDSYQRHALPAAVEVMVDFGTRKATQTSTTAAKTTASSPESETTNAPSLAAAEPSDLTTDQQQPAVNPNIYRFVVFLPSGSRPSSSQSNGAQLSGSDLSGSNLPAAGGSGP